MAIEKLTKWRDSQGTEHTTERSAIQADALYQISQYIELNRLNNSCLNGWDFNKWFRGINVNYKKCFIKLLQDYVEVL